MKRFFVGVLGLVLLWVGVAQADLQTINPLPALGTSFFSALTTFLRDETANRDAERFPAFVVSGGISATDSDLRNPTAIPVLDLQRFAGDDFCIRMQAAVAVLASGIVLQW